MLITTFKINKNRNYTIMSNYHLRDKNLSFKAKGLLSFMLSLPDDWDYSLNGLVRVSKENQKAIRSILNELKEARYLSIEQTRGEKGYYKYNYNIYEVPLSVIKGIDNPYTQKGYTEEGYTQKDTQINTNKQIDKIDKTIPNSELEAPKEIKHNVLTNELINLNYITDEDSSSFYYDSMFSKLLSEGYNYKQLYSAIHYIVPRVMARSFIDEDGNKITNKYGYLKTSIESNFKLLNNHNEELYPSDDNSSFWDDYKFIDDEGR